MLKTLLPADSYPGKSISPGREVTAEREVTNGVPAKNVCDGYGQITQTSVIDNLLLRDMKIKGTMCAVDVGGEIGNVGISAPGTVSDVRQSLKTISLDGTEAKSTVLSWPESKSTTEWRAVNYKTEYLLINANGQPLHHYVDNLDLRLIHAAEEDEAAAVTAIGSSDEHLVKLACDITPGIETKDDATSRDTQDRLIRFFKTDKSQSAQPFASVVASLNSSGVNTVPSAQGAERAQIHPAPVPAPNLSRLIAICRGQD